MCGILGLFHDKNSTAKLLTGLSILKNRGKEAYGLANSTTTIHAPTIPTLKTKLKTTQLRTNLLAHCLHAVINQIPQPLKRKGILIANCEIYNWKQLAKKHNFKAENDADLLLQLLDKEQPTQTTLNQLDGVYAFAYLDNNILTIARDILGVKPLWYSAADTFAFASEKKVLKTWKQNFIDELNPRTILHYNTKTKKITTTERTFFTLTKPHTKKTTTEKLPNILQKAITKRFPKEPFGILFSGGIDSSIIAKIAQQHKKKFTCYTTAVQEKNWKPSHDLIAARKTAKLHNFPLKEIILTKKDIPKLLKEVVPLIEDSNVVKVGVALPFYAACQQAKKDNIKVLFSGLGSEELFAGYQRHHNSQNINNECLSGLRKIYEKDLYRDDVITMNNTLELRLPFLDKQLTQFALQIPPQLKIKNNTGKYILRKIAQTHLNLDKETAWRPKKAAQYGSNTDKAIQKLAQPQTKSAYLKQFYPQANLKLGVLWSTGKDSCYAAHIMKKQNYELACLLTIQSTNPDSFMFHTPNIHLAKLHAKAANLPLIIQTTKGEKEKELSDMETLLKKAKQHHNIEGVIVGAILSTYQRDRVEKICDKLSLKIFSPLWHMDQELLIHNLLKENYEIIISSIAAEGFTKEWLGKTITKKTIQQLKQLNQINIAGEGGEYETLVLDCPLFNKKIKITKAKKTMDTPHSGRYTIEQAELKEKR